MSIYSSGAIGSEMRSSGLKNVSGRRVMPGEEELEEEENLQGLASPLPDFSNFIPPQDQNVPASDFGGQLTPQSYDVRANSVENEPTEERNMYQKIADWFRPSLTEDAMQRHGLGDPQPQAAPQPLPPPQTEQPSDVSRLSALKTSAIPHQIAQSEPGPSPIAQYLEPFGTAAHTYGTAEAPNKKLIEDANLRTQGIMDPEAHRMQQAEQEAAKQEEFKAGIDEAQKNPGTHVVYGATNEVANSPELQENWKEFTGQDFSPAIQEMTTKMEKIIGDMQTNNQAEMAKYDDQHARIKQRIDTNSTTDADKYFIGAALLMPLLVGAIFGKQAGLGALAGGFKGVTEALTGRQKSIKEDENLLLNNNKLRGENELRNNELKLKSLSIPQDVKKSLPKDPDEHLVGKKTDTYKDPATGEEKQVFRLRPGLVAPREYLTNKEEVAAMTKKADEVNEALIPTKEIGRLTSEIIDISSRLKDNSFIGSAIASYISGKDPSLATKTSQMVDFDGRQQNAMVLLESRIKGLVDAYRQAKGMRALTQSVQDHIEGLLRNPTTSFQSYQDSIDQMMFLRDLTQNRLSDTAKSAGFIPDYLMKEFGSENKGVNDKLNEKEGQKLSDKYLR